MSSRLWNRFTADYAANCRAWTHFPGNPILPPTGDGWRKRWTANPDLLTFQGRTLLYYRGNGTLAAGEPVHDRIGVAEVKEIGRGLLTLGDLTGDKPAIDVGPEGAFDDADALDPAAVVFRGKVWLYYSAISRSHPDSIGLAVSEDGVRFEKIGMVMTGRAPEVVLGEDGVLRMIYQVTGENGKYELRLAESADGLHFTSVDAGEIFPRKPGGWDSFSIVTCRIHDGGDGWHYMLYGGSAYLADEPEHFGLARSRNLIDWEPHPGNPIFGAGARGEADGGAIWFPALHETDNHFILLYEGSRGKYSWDLHSTICMSWIGKETP